MADSDSAFPFLPSSSFVFYIRRWTQQYLLLFGVFSRAKSCLWNPDPKLRKGGCMRRKWCWRAEGWEDKEASKEEDRRVVKKCASDGERKENYAPISYRKQRFLLRLRV